MRKALLVLLPGVLLGGCLTSEGDDEVSGFITNQPGNDAPIIVGSPDPAVMINEMYEFEPQAQDPDGDPLTFQIQNKPVWANFDSVTGRLYGQPTLGNIGTYGNISVSVTDGYKTDSVNFSVTVTDTALGSVSLEWQAPTENDDGSALTDLAGYKLYYGKDSGTYNNEIIITNPGMTNYVVDNLLPDTYYFSATAFNAAGVESGFAAETVRVVN